MATLAEMLRQGADRLINLPSEAQRFVTNPQAFTQLLTGKNPLPRETGFAAGATGLPAQEMSVLDPNQAPYMQGYSQGEPIGYAGMAAPFAAPAAVATAKALAPKAGQMAENYMVKQGMIQPLTAYHGTPHTIQGQFDINKVGTGEGAQAYGHGMYFAEAPDVAKSYMTVGGQGEFVKLGDKVVPTASQEGQVLADVTKLGRKAAINKYPDQADYIKTINPDNIQFEGGNLYKVDIPDADIPKMLDWDKPLNQQSAGVLSSIKIPQKAADKYNEISNKLEELQWTKGGLDSPEWNKLFEEAKDIKAKYGLHRSGEELYREAYKLAEKAGVANPSQAAAESLKQQGITGIRYLDEGSRKEGKGTSNFVVFEPSTVKILEQNNKPVTRKELIQEQINKIE
jgi:hypothetical protein